MRILLISPSESSFVNYSRAKRTVCVALPQLAAYTPPEHQLRIVHQGQGDRVYFDDVDLVGLSAMTCQAHQAYKIARYYRDRGVKVVMGGIHASMRPEEALDHVDAVCVGEGDGLWPRMIEDAAADRLEPIYRNEPLFPMEKILPLRVDLVGGMKTTFAHTVVQASRGCPYACDFCTTSALFGRKYRFRPVEQVIEEIRSRSERVVFFVDDNIIGSPAYARELFEKLIPLKKIWVGQASLQTSTRDPELLALARRSGAVGLFVGIESVNDASKRATGAGSKMGSRGLSDISRKLKILIDHGIMVQSSIVFGLDGDDTSVFQRTVEFLQKNKVALSSFCILTPYPGTRVHERFKEEGRLLHEDWSRYSNEHVVFQPRKMTPQQLKNGSDWAGTRYYSRRRIAARIVPNRRNLLYFLGMSTFIRRANLDNHGPGAVQPMTQLQRTEWKAAQRAAPIATTRPARVQVGDANPGQD